MNGNQNGEYKPKFIMPNSGEGNASSLSGVGAPKSNGAVAANNNLQQAQQHHNDNANLATANSRKQATPSGMRSEDYAKSLSSNSNGGSGGSSLSKEKAASLQNSVQNAKRMIAKEAIKKAGSAYGIPEPVTDKVLSTRTGQKAIDMALESGSMATPMGMLKNAANVGKMATDAAKNKFDKFADKHGNIGDEQETAKEKDQKKQEYDTEHGEMRFEFNLQTIKLLVILTPILSFLLFFMVIVVGALNDEKSSSMIVAGMVSDADGRELIKEVQKDAIGSGTTQLALGKGNEKYPDDYYKRLAKLGNNYSTQISCTGEDCLSRAEFLYYLKIADISIRYRNKYGIALDWFLISATNLYFDRDTEETMEANLSDYNKDKVEDFDTLSELDWDNDFKKMNGYTYLDADDSRYDLNILAKNMVRKETTQTCTDKDGNITKSQNDTDVEEMYFKRGAEKYLTCSAGESYSIHSTYTKDMDKFDEFMLEYIDNKMYKRGTGQSSSNPGTPGCVTTTGGYVWPIGSLETTQSNGKTYALGNPQTVNINSYFANSESFRGGKSHGGVDISDGGTGIGKTPVIASKSGTVIYPTSSSQTGFKDAGYYGNPDGGGFGNYVVIDHGDGLHSYYGHMAQNSITVKAGDVVDQGQVIGMVGHSGSSTGPHLHFEMRNGSTKVNPLNYVDPKNPRNGASSGECNSTGGNSLANAFVNLAVSQKDEPDAKGGKKYWSYMGWSSRVEWCATFVSWSIFHAEYNGAKLSDIINYKTSSVGDFMNHFYNAGGALKFIYNDNCNKYSGKNGSGTYTPKEGDLIFFDWQSSWDGKMPTCSNCAQDHVGIVKRTEGGVIYTIEGNAGDSVKELNYPLNSCQVIGFGSWY